MVGWVESGVDGTVIDLEARASAGVARVHVLDDGGPLGRSGVRVSLGAGAVPGVGLVGLRDEAAGWNTAVSCCSSEQLRVGGGHDVGPRHGKDWD